ncbi:MAG: glutamine--fructose-6-phosphate transaminase (isomerizing) [Candidatus Woesearchaeota archaeon]
MCGIVAYRGIKQASPLLLKCLRHLEYRGYDSVGMAVLSHQGIEVRKEVGKIDEADKRAHFEELKGNLGMAHTRWSTHGGVTQKNAHPHLSEDGKIAVVHNGIIENYQYLREFLKSKGIVCMTDTDTEVIPHLIQYHMLNGQDFRKAFVTSLRELEGSFAVVAIHSDHNFILTARRGSPLVLGFKDNELFAASDVPAFLEYTNKVIYLEDDEYAIMAKRLDVFSLKNDELQTKEPVTITWSIEQARKGEYAHFMLKEITEQKETIRKAAEQDPKLMAQVSQMLKDAFGIFFVGCGTSYHACVSASYQFAEIAKKHVNVILASEFRNYESFLTDKTVMVALSQSGETADTIEAIKTAKKHGTKIITIVNVMGSTITRLSDVNIMTHSGPEICVLSTKSYTAQLAILLSLAYNVAGREAEGKKVITKASLEVEGLIKENLTRLKALAKQLKGQHDIFLIGRDLAYPSALEGALKIKEVSYVHAEGFAGGELKHGTIALIEQGIPAIILATEHTRKEIVSNAMEIKARGGYIIGIDSEPNDVYDYHIKVAEAGMANPILMIIPLQILAYYLALERGCDPDKPRNLAKSVTVK